MSRDLFGHSYPETRYRVTSEATRRYARARSEAVAPKLADAEAS